MKKFFQNLLASFKELFNQERSCVYCGCDSKPCCGSPKNCGCDCGCHSE